MVRASIAAFLLCFLANFGAAQLTQAEKKGIEDSLFIGNLKLEDLKFAREPFKDPLRLKAIERAIDDPLASADALMAWHASAATGRVSALGLTALLNGFEKNTVPKPPAVKGAAPADWKVPEAIKPVILALVAQIQQCDSDIKASLGSLTPEEQRELIEGLPVWAVEEPKITFDFVHGKPATQKRVLQLLSKVDHMRILEAGVRLAADVEQAEASLRLGKFQFVGSVRANINGLPVLVCGTGPDVHDETDARLTIDLGGNDTYLGRHGAGVGYSSVLLDLAGDDQYNVKDLSVGAGVLGVGIAIDGGGNDSFRGKSICFGSGLCGMGLFEKDGGNDLYQATSLAQGFGLFGIGLCLDTSGDDVYNVKLFGQGAARTQGVGWLVDRQGSDQYRAGGLSMNEPLFTGVAYSFSQGFGSGYREDTGGVSGGIGLLTDLQGDDFYLGETYMQAASYWFSIGTLFDANGNDTYTGTHYCQASAMHCCGAYLFDLAGNDSYITKVGASLSIGHDYGVSFLLDRAGDDIYAARDSTPGVGVANGLGIFVDGDGIDRYDGPPGQGNAARGTGSLGVFVDLGGQDRYRTGLEDAEGTTSSTWGTAYDKESVAEKGSAAPDQHQPPKPGSLPKPSDAEMEKIYALATQWGVGSAQQSVQDNVDKLIGIGLPGFEWMLDKHLATADRLQIRTFVAVAKALGPDAGGAVGPKAIGGSKAEKRNLIAIAMEAGIKDVGAILGPLMEDPDLRDVAIRAAGPLKATGAIESLNRMCLSDDKLLARSAMVSLSQIGSPDSVGTALAMLRSTDFLTREAAVSLLAQFPATLKDNAMTLLGDSDEARARLGLRLLAKLGGEDNYKAIAGSLLDPRPGLRIEALLQLDGHCPQEFGQAFLSLQKDPVPVVRAVAKRVRISKQP